VAQSLGCECGARHLARPNTLVPRRVLGSHSRSCALSVHAPGDHAAATRLPKTCLCSVCVPRVQLVLVTHDLPLARRASDQTANPLLGGPQRQAADQTADPLLGGPRRRAADQTADPLLGGPRDAGPPTKPPTP
jgi:hypothetical protein